MYLGGRISRLFIGVAVLFGIIGMGAFTMNRPVSAVAGINEHLNFQGRLYNAQGAIVPDGNYNIQFKIYQDGAGTAANNPGGTLEWTENWLNSGGNGVQIKNGYLSVELGTVNAFGSSIDWNQDTLWLSMNIGDTTSCTISTDFDTDCSGDGEMLPMKRMSSSVYSLNSGRLGGLDSSQFVQLAQGVQTDASSNTTSIYLNKTAGGNFLQLQSSSTDVFTLSNSGDIEFGANNDHTISVATAGAGTGGYDLTVSAGTGGSGTGSAGGDLVLQGGAAGGTDGNGGNVQINAGAKTGTGTDGTISIGTSNTSAITLGADTTVTGSSFTVSGSSSLALNKGSDYSTISGNDVNFGSGSVFRLTGASSQTITGIAGGTDGRMITLINSSSFNATLSNLSGSSSAANQISTGTGADMILSVGGAISMIYDSGASKWRVVAAAADSAGAGGVTLQGSTPGTADVGNINVTGTIIGDVVQGTSHIYTPDLDTVSAGPMTIGTSVATGITIGSASITTTIQGNLAVTLSSTTGTTMVCQNGSGYFSDCDSSYQAPTSTNFIQNQNSSQQTGNYWISGVARADGGVLASSIDVAAAGTLSIGTTTATAITIGQSGVDTTIAGGLIVTEASTFNEDVTIAAGKSLTLTGGNTASRPGSPTAGMLYYDTDTDQLLTYNGSKWQADRSTTTKIVAASNSSQAVKDAADYVADGTSDESEINSALTAAAGGTVYLAEGTFVAGGTILVPNNTILAGAGNGTTIELADLDATDNLIENKDSTAGNATPGSGVVIRDLKLDGRSDLNTAGTQYGIYFSDMGSGTGSTAVQGSTITNLRVTRFRTDGTYLTASSNNTITNSNFRNNGAVGLSINASSNNNVISNNRFQGNGAEGFVLSSSSYNNISGNNSEANTTLGMNFTSGGSRNTISGNNINSNGTSGMRLSGETRSTIVGNVIRGGGASNYGIYMLNSSNNNAVSSNNIYDTGSAGYTNGIFLDVASYNNLTNNVIGDSSCNFECNAININNAGATNNFLASNNIDSGAAIRDTGTGTIYGGQNSGTAFRIQPGIDMTLGGASTTTTIQGNTAVTLSSTTGTTMVCQNGSGYLSDCDSSLLAPTATNFIQNQNSSDQTANFRISGVAQANTSVLTPLVGRATAGTLSIGTDANSTAITIGQSGVTTTNAGNLTVSGTTALNDNVTVASGKTLRVTGDSRANITSIGSPAAGMITYDTTNNQLLTYNGTKWMADGKDAILVAASDSSQADKDAADYVADGTADDVEIQAALNAADPAGSGRKTGKVYLFAGTYNVSTDITIENNTTIAGAGRGTLLSLVSTTSAVKVLTNDDTSTGEGVTIQNLRIDGNNGTVGAQYGIYLDNMGGGTGASARQGAKVNNVTLTRFNTANMYLNASSHGTFSGISSQGSDGDGIGLSSSYYNTFTGNTLSGNTGDGFDISGSHDVTLVGNTIQNNSGAGLSASTSSYTLSVTGNTFRQNGTNGITFSQVTYSTVSNNSFYSNTGDGINVVGGASSSLSITGNNIYNSSGDGVDLTATHTSITGNTLVSNTDGIVVRNGSNEVTGNISRSNSNAGIALDGTSADDNTVSGNTVSSNTVYGIYLSNADDNSITGNRVFNNGGLTTNNSIYLTASDSNSIQSNTISDTNASSDNYSINIFNATSDTNYLSDNTLGTGTINDAGTGTRYGGQSNSTAYLLQPGTNITIGSASTTTTLQGNTAVNLSGTTGTTLVCQNGSSYLSACDASILAPTATNFIQNQNSSDQTANFRISGVAQANTSVLTPLVGRATAGTLSIGTDANSTAITIGQSGVTTTNAGNLTVSGTTTLDDDVTIAASKSLTLTGGNTASRPASPTAGMVYYDSEVDQLLVYNGSKWKAEGSSAYKMVAASDSSQAYKDAADYVADGTSDQSEINSALTAAADGTVYLAPGTYSTDGSISIPNNTILAGSGRDSIIEYSEVATGAAIVNTDTSTGKNITVRDLKLDGRSDLADGENRTGIDFSGLGDNATSTQGATIENLEITRFLYVGIHFDGTDNSSISNISYKGNGIIDTHVENSSLVVVKDSHYKNSGGAYIDTSSGIEFANNTLDATYNVYAIALTDSNIYNNTIINGLSDVSDIDAIAISGTSSNVSITGNYIDNNDGTGINVVGTGSKMNISNNTIQNSTNAGMYLNLLNDSVISNNVFDGNATTGIQVAGNSSRNIVSNNRIQNSGGTADNDAISVGGSGATGNSVVGNNISDTAHSSSNDAIVNSGTSTYIANNTLSDGSINDTGTSTVYGGQTDNAGNYIVQPTGDIELQGDTNVTGTLTATTALQAPLLDTSAVEALYIGTTNASSINLMKNTNLVGDLTLDAAADRTISIGTSAASTAGSQLTIAAGTGGSGSGSIGGDLVLQGGAAGGTNANGGSVYLDAGAKTGTGTDGTIALGTVRASTIQIGSTTLSSGTQTINIGNNNTSGGTTNVVIGSGGSATAGTTTLQAKDGITINTNGVTRQTFNNTNTVYFGNGVTAAAPNAFTISGTGSSTSGTAGGALSIQGGNATVGNANGGNLTLSGGTGVGSGSNGLVVLTTPTFQTVTNDANCYTGGSLVASSCTMAASSVNNSSAIIVGFNTIGQTATMPDPTITTAGRIVYVTAANSSQDFTLSVNGGGTGNTIAMRQNTTATMIWNGSDWTAAGASSSTTLQSAYDNTLQSAGGAELVVSSTGNTNGLTIRDSSVNPVNDTLLSIQSSSAANLFSVNSNVTEYASNAGAENYSGTTSTFPASTWSALTGATVSRNTSTANIATGQGSAQATTTTSANSGIKNQLNTALTASQHYNVSFTAKLASGTFTDMGVYYSIDGSADSVTCSTGEAIKTSVWTKVNCTFTAPSSGITSSNSINIRQVGSGTARTFYIDNLSVTIAADYNYATDGTVNDTGNFATNWTSTGTGSTVTHNTSDGQEASDSAQAVITTGGSNRGVRNQIAINPLTSTLYRVSVYAKQTAGAAFTDFGIRYSRDGGTNFVDCVDYNTQTVDNTWTQITCYIQTDSTAPSGSGPYMYFVAGSSANRTFLVDTFSMTLASKSTPNVQIGGGAAGGPTTLFTLDKGASAPIAANNDDLLGSMYYDTTLGKLQCYEADGWGACGSSPDNIVTISPEYTNAVLHGTGIGTMTSDLCSDTLNINDGSSGQATICGTNETYNFYKWTSPQSSAQTYSIYVTYQLPSTFKSFQSGETSIMGRTDDANATVNYQIYRNNSASGLTTCGSAVTVSTGSVSSWQTGVATGAADPSTCGFVGGDSVVFKINVTASQNANAYVGNLNFTFSNR